MSFNFDFQRKQPASQQQVAQISQHIKDNQKNMSGQYGEPDWANPTASSAPASSEPAASGGDGGWTTSATAGEDFSSAVVNNTTPNTGGRNASGWV